MGASPDPLGMTMIRERLLIRRLQQREERAFQEVVRLYQHKVWNLVFRMIGSREEAEDIAQEVFVTVFKSIDGFRGDSKLSTWLYRIAANHCKNRMKYLGRRSYKTTGELDEAAERELQGAQPSALTPHLDGPEKVLEGLQMEKLVQEAIALLDEDHRVLVVLRDVEDLSYQEITAITGLAEGTVKSRLHRARMALKDYLAKRGG
ncbi:MAG: sigma-70 family RNA polymerase sigma factor [Myxococcales bacterium]|nr:sigma-70 family RNA polymerase sigma factor [Myxococcales bacterium]